MRFFVLVGPLSHTIGAFCVKRVESISASPALQKAQLHSQRRVGNVKRYHTLTKRPCFCGLILKENIVLSVPPQLRLLVTQLLAAVAIQYDVNAMNCAHVRCSNRRSQLRLAYMLVYTIYKTSLMECIDFQSLDNERVNAKRLILTVFKTVLFH